MYERHYGTRYNEVNSVKDAAAQIRKELRAGSKDPDSPLYQCGISVRYRTFAGGCSIDTRITAPWHVRHDYGNVWPEDINDRCQVCDLTRHEASEQNREIVGRYGHHWHTAKAVAAVQVAETLMNRYNHDGSDIMTDYFDVRFYGHATIEEKETT